MFSTQTFTIREVGTDIGSYTRYTSANLSEFADTEFFLSAGPTGYGVNEVAWSAPTLELASEMRPVDVSIRWSTFGEPQTAEDGFSLVDGVFGSGTFEHDLSSVSTYQGNWVYYSLFIRYSSTTPNAVGEEDQFFERVASVAVLMPRNYNSVEELWMRIPEYFRIQDTNNDLYNYLAIFGWDLDQLRTIIDYLMVQRDPSLSSSLTLQYLMEELGTVITTLELGAARARNYMQDIINLRLAKGTEDGLRGALQAITGCRVAVDQLLRKINIYPQRVNWARDSRLKLGLSSENAWYSVVSDSSFVRFSVDTLTFANASAAVPFNVDVQFSGASVAFNPVRSVINEGTNTANVYVLGKYLVPAEASDTFYFSADQPNASLINFVALYYTDGSLAASAGFSDTNTVLRTGDGKTYFKLYMDDSPAGDVYLVVGIVLPAGAYALFDKFLLEKGFMGTYFDGYTNYGGWLRGSTDRSDYRWHNGSTTPSTYPYTTYGIYTADAWRVRKTVQNIYKSFIPVNWADLYTVVFDYLPSYSATPLSSGAVTLPSIIELFNLVVTISGNPFPLGFDYTTDADTNINANVSWPKLV